ncbi:hypothetical protein [Nocardia gipuzkoensis]|nr:hypothetical protein [Nocardia gipuzkoensis]
MAFGFLVSSQGGSGFAVAVEGGNFIAEGASALAAQLQAHPLS